MEIILGKTSGFCFGVKSAISGAEKELEKNEKEGIPEEIQKLVDERTQARKNKDFARSDEIRDILLEKGVTLKDTRDGVQIIFNK